MTQQHTAPVTFSKAGLMDLVAAQLPKENHDNLSYAARVHFRGVGDERMTVQQFNVVLARVGQHRDRMQGTGFDPELRATAQSVYNAFEATIAILKKDPRAAEPAPSKKLVPAKPSVPRPPKPATAEPTPTPAIEPAKKKKNWQERVAAPKPASKPAPAPAASPEQQAGFREEFNNVWHQLDKVAIAQGVQGGCAELFGNNDHEKALALPAETFGNHASEARARVRYKIPGMLIDDLAACHHDFHHGPNTAVSR